MTLLKTALLWLLVFGLAGCATAAAPTPSGHSEAATPYGRSDAAPQPTSDAAPQPTSDAAPQPATVTAPQPATVTAPQPATVAAPQPATVAAPQPATVAAPQPTTVAAPQPTTVAAPQPTTVAAPQQYFLSAWLDYPAHRISVSETITYVNTTGVTLADLPLVVEPNRRAGVFTLRRLAWGSGDAPVYTLDGALLTLALPRPLAAQESVTVMLDYELALPLVNAPLGYTGRQSNFGDWYPFIPAYRDGWLIYPPTGVGEHLAYDTAEYTVEIRASDPAVIIAASGGTHLGDETPVEDGTPAGTGERYRLEAARSFAWSASPEFVVAGAAAGPAMVESYSLPEHVAAGEVVLQETVKAVQLYAELFGSYPHTGLAVVEADFFDGMEYDGLYFLGHEYYAAYAGSPQGWLTVIAVHETAHQWWYALVGNDPAREPWLDEALCTFTERLFFERYYPEDVDWWQGFRLARYSPAGWVDNGIADFDGFRAYVNAVYLRGAMFLQALRQRMGDAAFFEFLRAYAAAYRGQLASGQGFFQLLESYTGEIADLLAEYFQICHSCNLISGCFGGNR